MALVNGLEVELAVAKGEAFLYKVRFRPSSILTVGTNPMTAVTLDGEGVPDFLEFLNITTDGVLLRFTPDVRVEVLSGAQVLTTQALIDDGFAKRVGDAFGVDLAVGSKAVLRLGGHKLMIKVDIPTSDDVLMVQATSEDDATCGRCGTRLRLVLAGGGALTPCAACGALNRVTLASTKQQQLEDQATRVAIPTTPVADQPQDEPETASNLAENIDPGSSTGRAVGDLPTFDAISVLKDGGAGTDEATREALSQLGLGDSKSGGGGVANLASPDSVDPGSSTGRAASDLPTFDAIAVLKDDSPPQKAPSTVNLADPGAGSAPAEVDEEPAAGSPPAEADEEPAAESTPSETNEEPSAESKEAPTEEAAEGRPAEKEVAVSTTPANQEPSADEPTANQATGDHPSSTGQWEETLTIQAVKPKKSSMLIPIVVIALALLGIVGLALTVVVVKFVLPGLLG